jgi:hypothetical protein
MDNLGTAGMILLFCAGNSGNTIHYIESVGGVEAGGPPAGGCGDGVPLTLGTAGMILLSCAGNNGNTIHHIESVGGVEAGDLLSMDVGTEYQIL